MKKVEASISILERDGNITISIHDYNARVLIAEVSLSAKDFCKAAMGGLMGVKCEAEYGDIENIGRKALNKKLTFETPNLDCGNRKEAAYKIALERCPKGWTVDNYFSSQDSFSVKDGKHYATCVIRSFE